MNLTGATLMVREVVAKMAETKAGPGVIVNMSSIARHGNRGQSNYVAAKAAIAANTVTWAREFASVRHPRRRRRPRHGRDADDAGHEPEGPRRAGRRDPGRPHRSPRGHLARGEVRPRVRLLQRAARSTWTAATRSEVSFFAVGSRRSGYDCCMSRRARRGHRGGSRAVLASVSLAFACAASVVCSSTSSTTPGSDAGGGGRLGASCRLFARRLRWKSDHRYGRRGGRGVRSVARLSVRPQLSLSARGSVHPIRRLRDTPRFAMCRPLLLLSRRHDGRLRRLWRFTDGHAAPWTTVRGDW